MWYNNINYGPILEMHFCLDKDVNDQFKKMDEIGFSCFLNHMLTQNVQNMADMAFVKKVFIFFFNEKYYVKNCGQSLKITMTVGKELRKHILKVRHILKEKNEEIENKDKENTNLKSKIQDMDN